MKCVGRCFFERLFFLFRYRNVYFDTSSIDDDHNIGIISILEKAIHAMPDRFIFGSDYACCSQTEHIAYFQSLDILEREKQMLFFENSERVYGVSRGSGDC